MLNMIEDILGLTTLNSSIGKLSYTSVLDYSKLSHPTPSKFIAHIFLYV